MVPAGTPPAVVDRLSSAIEKIMSSADLRQQFSNIAVEIDYRRVDEFNKYLRFISTRFTDVIKANNIKAE